MTTLVSTATSFLSETSAAATAVIVLSYSRLRRLNIIVFLHLRYLLSLVDGSMMVLFADLQSFLVAPRMRCQIL